MVGSPSPVPGDGVRLEERSLGTMPWLVVSGPRTDCFHALGAHANDAIRAVVATLPELAAVRRVVATPEGLERRAAVLASSEARFAPQMAEVAAMAHGAGVDPETLLLLNLRGELAHEEIADCSDLLMGGERWILGHNEDGDPHFEGALCAVTLRADG